MIRVWKIPKMKNRGSSQERGFVLGVFFTMAIYTVESIEGIVPKILCFMLAGVIVTLQYSTKKKGK